MIVYETTSNFRVRKFILLVGVFLVLSYPVSMRCEEQTVTSICELFEDLQSYSGKLIKVRGGLMPDRHSFALGQKGCASQFAGGGVRWGTIVNLVEAGSRILESPVAFVVNRVSVERMAKILCFLHSDSPSDLGVEITATFVGELQMHKQYPMVGTKRPFGGFGHGGLFPAQLVYKSVENIVVKQIP